MQACEVHGYSEECGKGFHPTCARCVEVWRVRAATRMAESDKHKASVSARMAGMRERSAAREAADQARQARKAAAALAREQAAAARRARAKARDEHRARKLDEKRARALASYHARKGGK